LLRAIPGCLEPQGETPASERNDFITHRLEAVALP